MLLGHMRMVSVKHSKEHCRRSYTVMQSIPTLEKLYISDKVNDHVG